MKMNWERERWVIRQFVDPLDLGSANRSSNTQRRVEMPLANEDTDLLDAINPLSFMFGFILSVWLRSKICKNLLSRRYRRSAATNIQTKDFTNR